MSAVDADRGTTTLGEERQYSEVSKGYTYFENGDLLIAKITPCFENGKIAQATLSHPVGFGSTEFHVVRVNAERLDERYLLHFLRQRRLRLDGEKKMTGSGGQKRVPANFIKELELPVPSLQEQKRIAAILDKADALRAKRRKALEQLDALAQAVFIEMFSTATVQGWKEVPIELLASQEPGAIRTGPFGSQLLHSEFTDEGVAVLGIDNAVQNEFAWGESRYVSMEKYKQLSRYTVKPGDVIITIMGTCGRCAVVPQNIPLAINTKHLCCITLDQAKCLPDFLHAYFLRHPLARGYLERTAKGAIMSGLNMGLIKSMPVKLPPLELQAAFVRRIEGIRKQKAILRGHARQLDALFSSLQHRAFRGEL